MLPGERLVVLVAILLVSFIAEAIIFYVWGYKEGRKDEGIEWAEKEDYYKWLLEMKKRQDFEEVRFADEKQKRIKTPKKVKERKYCDICGKVIKKGALCYECKKAGW